MAIRDVMHQAAIFVFHRHQGFSLEISPVVIPQVLEILVLVLVSCFMYPQAALLMHPFSKKSRNFVLTVAIRPVGNTAEM